MSQHNQESNRPARPRSRSHPRPTKDELVGVALLVVVSCIVFAAFVKSLYEMLPAGGAR